MMDEKILVMLRDELLGAGDEAEAKSNEYLNDRQPALRANLSATLMGMAALAEVCARLIDETLALRKRVADLEELNKPVEFASGDDSATDAAAYTLDSNGQLQRLSDKDREEFESFLRAVGLL